jgi:hypothetical protein
VELVSRSTNGAEADRDSGLLASVVISADGNNALQIGAQSQSLHGALQ